jgi:hypothetical protein
LRITVSGNRARLFLDGKSHPAFLVNDLKLGISQCGGVGVWLESGTIAHFRKLRASILD